MPTVRLFFSRSFFFGGILFLNDETWRRDEARQERKENDQKKWGSEIQMRMRMAIDTRKFSDRVSHLHVLRWACHLGQPPRSRFLFRVKIKTPKDFGIFLLENVEILNWILSIFK